MLFFANLAPIHYKYLIQYVNYVFYENFIDKIYTFCYYKLYSNCSFINNIKKGIKILKKFTSTLVILLFLASFVNVSVLKVHAENDWQHNGIILDGGNIQYLGTSFKLTANVSGNTAGLQYRFVWMKGNWDAYATICEFGSDRSTDWIPMETGDYTLFSDVKGPTGEVVTRTQKVYIIPDLQDINWQAVIDSGIQFAIIRSGWSTGINGN